MQSSQFTEYVTYIVPYSLSCIACVTDFPETLRSFTFLKGYNNG